jgi:glycosyltransferase involved in cell wall biosynthesis
VNVIYDISVLAHAQRDPKARTGVFRVVDNVARGLVDSHEVDVRFCVAEGVNDPVDFLASDAQLKDVALALSASTRFRLRLYRQIHRLTDRVGTVEPGMKHTSIKALRKSLYGLAEFSALPRRILNNDDLASAAIYHSPFRPIPKQAREVRGLKRFLTVYDLIPILYPALFEADLNTLVREALSSLGPADFAICISESTKNDLCNHRPDLDPARVFVTPLAASGLFYPCNDADRLAQIRLKYGIPVAVPYLLTLSTLEPRKNIEQVIKVFARLVKEQSIDDLHLVLVGAKGWKYEKIVEAVRNMEVSEDRIILTGYVADEDLAPLYSGALAFMYVSLYEGFGLPPLEAMQCGTAVITSNRSSLPEVVGDAGIMLDPFDEDGACQAILELYRNPALRAQMRRRSLDRSRQFNWKRSVSETIAAYRDAVNS